MRRFPAWALPRLQRGLTEGLTRKGYPVITRTRGDTCGIPGPVVRLYFAATLTKYEFLVCTYAGFSA